MVWLAWILKEEGPRRGLLRDCEIFANLHLQLSPHSPGAVHPEAGDAHHGPAAAELAGEQRAATVAVTRVTCPVTSTQLRRAWVDIE